MFKAMYFKNVTYLGITFATNLLLSVYYLTNFLVECTLQATQRSYYVQKEGGKRASFPDPRIPWLIGRPNCCSFLRSVSN